MGRRRSSSTGSLELLHTVPDHQPVIGPTDTSNRFRLSRLPRLARHTISLSDGHEVGIAVCGRGVPLVVVHGFSAEGVLYAQSLSRMVSAGFKVVAIDTAGHGGTQGLPTGGANLESYSRLLGRVIDELGIRRAVLAGHSMGGRLVTELAAEQPERAIAVILLDAIVGETWDRLVYLFRFNPALLAGIGVMLAADTMTTAPFFRDPRQAAKLGRLTAPMMRRHFLNPLHLVGPGVSILRSRSTKWMLQKLRAEGVPVIAVHGECDLAVPLSTARSAARLSGGELVVVQRAGHSWILKDPETFPAILRELLHGRLGMAVNVDALVAAGLDPTSAGIDDIERAMYEPDAPILRLTPPFDPSQMERRTIKPRYHWRTEQPAAKEQA
jgi:pimeloyl-ACP methyl ester carboxylesterase